MAASLILRQLASYPRQNGLAAALREVGRLERTLFTLDWLGDAELRRQTSRELNKGETRNSLARAVFIRRLGEIRDRTYENQQHRASGLNLLVTAIILWNTRYLERAVAALRQTEDVPDQLLAHLSPLGWEHVNLTGDYIWSAERPATENRDGWPPDACSRSDEAAIVGWGAKGPHSAQSRGTGLQHEEFRTRTVQGVGGDVSGRDAHWPEVTKRLDLTHKRTNHELRRPCEGHRAPF